MKFWDLYAHSYDVHWLLNIRGNCMSSTVFIRLYEVVILANGVGVDVLVKKLAHKSPF